MMLRWIIILSASLIAHNVLPAQEKSLLPYNYTLSVQPVYLFNSGLRVDFEKQLKHPSHWLQISAKGYYLSRSEPSYFDYFIDNAFSVLPLVTNDDGYYATKLKGGGIEASYKWFFPKANFIYLSAGLSYGYFDVRYSTVVHRFTSHKEQLTDVSQKFNRIGLNSCFGIETPRRNRFFVGAHVGLGLNYSFYDGDKYAFDMNMMGVGHRGVSLIVGTRLGFRFGKKNTK